ncbi:plasma membrane fusion protein prm1 [Diatrype stigma]|uniref:Plasma membrane fusion protein PRM1 n=1 Tax=Diatrype stigma TaxID=117547 RepID=A0AAN9V0P4_9PEZI
MSFSEKRGFPQIPPSLNTGPYEKQSGPNPPSIPSPSRQRPRNEVTPYLGLPARLSQTWLNRWTVLLLLVLVHFLLTASSLQDGLDDSKVKAMSACKKVEDTGSAMASMPHYLSRGVNSLVADGITSSVHALVTVLEMIITSVEQLILFFIHMMTDTYVCLVALAVHGALNVSAVVVEKTTDAMNKAIDGFADGLMKTTDGIQDVIDGGWNTIESLANAGDKVVDGGKDLLNDIGVFGRRDFIPTIDSELESALPTSPTSSLSLSPSSPTFTVLHAGDDLAPESSAATLVARIDIPDKPDIKKPLNDFFQKIKDVNIDSSGFVSDINKLNDDLPTFDEVRNKTDETINIPFQLVRDALDKAYGNWSFDKGVFPVAEREALSFCSENSAIADFFDALYATAHQAKIAAIVILSALAVLACAPMAYWERLRWNRQARHAELFARHQYDHLDAAYMYARPHTARAGLSLMRRLEGRGFSRRKQILARWCVAYATSLPALFVLSLALAGFFSCACQGVLLRAVEKEVPALSAQVGEFAEDVVYSLGNVSKKWADDGNGVIDGFSHDLNDDILGHVTSATSAVNDTINTFTKAMDEGLTKVLGNTPFKDAAAGVIRCVVGLKIESVQKGLTWIHDHAHVDLPRFPDDIYSAGAKTSIGDDPEVRSFLAAPGSGTADEVTDAVLHVTRWLRNNIIQEALISLALLLVYVLVVLIGVVWALVRAMSPDPDDHLDGTQFRGGDITTTTIATAAPPRSLRRSKSYGGMGSPRFNEYEHATTTGAGAGGNPFADDYSYGHNHNPSPSYSSEDEPPRGDVPRGRGTVVEEEHAGSGTRSSSHGYVGDVNRS